ncbi:MAG: UDP-N-acetylmuramoyl-tripeptide--D-alanyl-D-alanine ligase [bacterium]|nr:UDP-N-acetylmuramoyl-tripeptide--D-alanyl-D-alanine ligase [bacterium]
MKELLEKILYNISQQILKRHKPDVIGITGSVGKTSAKEAVSTVLSAKYSIRKTQGNYNNEIGVPLTIIGNSSGGKNPFKWLWILFKGFVYGLLPLPYPDMLVLEMGADKPGDIKYLCELSPVHIGIVTAIGDQPVHLEFFKDVDDLAKEKMMMYTHQTQDDWAILNLDESRTRDVQKKVKSKTISIGINQLADLQAVEIEYSTDPRELKKTSHIAGLRFKINSNGSIVPFFIPRVVGNPPVYATLIAAAVGQIYGMNLVQVSEAMKLYNPAKGRMNLIVGLEETLIIDDTYNSSPAAVREALEVLTKVKSSGYRVVCLGNMEELGKQEKRAHTLIGKKIAEMEIDYLYTVGDKAKWIAEAAVVNGMEQRYVKTFNTSDVAGVDLKGRLIDCDLILVKGSQSARMEKVVKAIMKNPEEAKKMLVRQYGAWLKS